MRFWIALTTLLLSCCGRIGFDSLANEAPGRADAAVADGSNGAEHKILIGVQGMSASYVVSLLWAPGSALPARVAEPPLRLDLMNGPSLRSFLSLDESSVFAGSGSTPSGVVISSEPLTELSTRQTVLGTLNNFHGACALPGGNFIAGEFTVGSGNQVEEYSVSANGDLTAVRPVYTTTVNRGVLAKCHAVSDTEIYLVDNDSTNDVDGDLVRLTQNAGVWSEVARFDLSQFAMATYGVHQTSLWGFAIVSDEIFAFPIHRHANRIPNLIRCSLPNLDNCVELGGLPPDATETSNDPDLIQGVAAASAGQLVFTTGRSLFRYDLVENQYYELIDLSSSLTLLDENGMTDPILALRNIVVR